MHKKDNAPFPKATPASYASDQRHSTLCAKSFFACRVTGLKIPSTPREPSAEHDAQKGQCPFSEGDARELCERSAAQYSMCQVFFCVSGDGVENSFDPARAFGRARCRKGQHTLSEGDARELRERSAAQYFMCQVFFCVSDDGVENSFDPARAFVGGRAFKIYPVFVQIFQ